MFRCDSHFIDKGGGDDKKDQENEDQIDQGRYIDLRIFWFLTQSPLHAWGLRVAMETSLDFLRAWATILARMDASAHWST